MGSSKETGRKPEVVAEEEMDGMMCAESINKTDNPIYCSPINHFHHFLSNEGRQRQENLHAHFSGTKWTYV